MRVDLTQDGNKDVDIELNGTKLENVLWADDATGECEVFETEWRTGELVKAPDTEWGYRTMRLRGKVKINDRRPKAPAGATVYDFQYPGLCYLQVTVSRYDGDSSFVWVASYPDGAPVQSFTFEHGPVGTLGAAIFELVERLTVHHIAVDQTGLGGGLIHYLNVILPAVAVQPY